MSTLELRLAANLAAVRRRMAAACDRAGRNADDVQLIAVVKYAGWDSILALVDLGVRDLAENRPQQLLERAARLERERPELGVRWHLIGHLQRNKVRPVLPVAHLIHSVDSVRLLERIDTVARECGLRPRVLLEVNVSGEASKDGFSPDLLRETWPQIVACQRVEIGGLMTMAPWSDRADASRPTFATLRRLRDELARRGEPGSLAQLSMGMSGDFETAIEEGATLVRIGSRLFEGCDGAPASG